MTQLATTKRAMVINGHGSKTNDWFAIENGTLVTPEDLQTPYIFSIDPNFHIENTFRNGQLYPIKNGHWTLYEENKMIPDVKIDPWKAKEAQQFAKRLIEDKYLWSNIDGEQGYLHQRDPNAVMVIRHNGENVYLMGQDLQAYCQKLINNEEVPGVPYIFITPKIGKVKVLNSTSLSEIMQAYTQAFGPELFMLATCNAEGFASKTVHLETDKYPTPIEQIFGFETTKPAILNAYKTTAKPAYIENVAADHSFTLTQAAPAA